MSMFEVELASRGGAPLFQPFHILKALWHIQQSKIIGRKELSAKLAIGEGSTRKLLTYLEEKGWASSTRQGISLTSSGTKLLDGIGILASEVKGGHLTVDEKDYAIRLRGASTQVDKGIEQRDQAMIVGASGATTLVYHGRLEFSDGYEAYQVDSEAGQQLVRDFELEENDVLIIGSAQESGMAEDGAFSAAVLTLMSKKLKK